MNHNLSPENIDALIKYRLTRAEEMLQVAQSMIESGWLSSAINRLYYGCFYASLALFLKYEVNAKSHEGVIGMLGLKFIKDGILSPELGRHYRRLFNARVTGDYDDFSEFSEEQVEKFMADSKKYIATINTLLIP